MSKELVYPIFAQISGNMLKRLESRDQLLSRHCPGSCRVNLTKALKTALDYVMSIVPLIWPKFRCVEQLHSYNHISKILV